MTATLEESKRFYRRAGDAALEIVRETLALSWTLLKIMVPVMILTKILMDLGVINWIGKMLGPLMALVGLPGSMGLVLAGGMIVSPYLALVLYAALAPENPLSVAQVTVLGSMILMAHAMLMEVRIAQKAGMRITVQLLLRIGGAFLYGAILFHIYKMGNWLQTPGAFLLGELAQGSSGWLAWAWEQAKSLALILVIILALMTFMRILEAIGVIQLLKRLLSPLLQLLGMGKEAAPITIIGMTLGMVLGGGLVIQEAKSGKMKPHEIFFSMSLMCIFHSLIEDTAVMMLMGAHLSGLLWIRLAFTLVAIFLLTKAVRLLPQKIFDRFLFRAPV
jgi:hypothetical protein